MGGPFSGIEPPLEFSTSDRVLPSFPRKRESRAARPQRLPPGPPLPRGDEPHDRFRFEPHSRERGMQLYTYYRSQASFRVRIALNLKGISREDSFLHLEKGDQFADAYRAINPQMVVPTLIDG